MDLSAINPVVLLASVLVSATPILLAATGELVVERAGVLNLGVEGMMVTGAVAGFAGAVLTGSPVLGFLVAALGGAALSLLFAFLTQVMLANQVASGLALTLFGVGFAALLGKGYIGETPPQFPLWKFTVRAADGDVAAAVATLDLIVPLAIAIVATVWAILKFTRAGLVLRAVGENHEAAHALGYKVVRIRTLAIVFGGAMAGLGGAYISMIRVPTYTENVTAGAGWIALALVVFGSWRPGRVMLGAWLFGGVSMLQLNLQGTGVSIPVQYLAMSPYIVTILVLVIMSNQRNTAPGSLGRSFHAAG